MYKRFVGRFSIHSGGGQIKFIQGSFGTQFSGGPIQISDRNDRHLGSIWLGYLSDHAKFS